MHVADRTIDIHAREVGAVHRHRDGAEHRDHREHEHDLEQRHATLGGRRLPQLLHGRTSPGQAKAAT